MTSFNNKGDDIMSSPSSLYMIHKYWGKKPSLELKKIIHKYSKEDDWLLDPFAGYGGFALESRLMNRNVIANDLNPISNDITSLLLNENIDLKKCQDIFNRLKSDYESEMKKWYVVEEDVILTTLRSKDDIPIRIRYTNKKEKKVQERELTGSEISNLQNLEKMEKILNWYPQERMISNSRISVKENEYISDLFCKRSLYCNAFLLDLINKIQECPEKQVFVIAFTANIANCSKLVPPIKSRGKMSQGAWMTGFYVGNEYLENNVFHYYENRVKKILKAKEEYYKILNKSTVLSKYKITNNDAKHLDISSKTMDFIFTDFPYGDTVPYFEQSQLWNMWLKHNVDYLNEIVVSDSRERQKDIKEFTKDITYSIEEISRVLKDNCFFVFTFHSLYGNEWTAIINALVRNNFEFVESEVIVQKTATPRQLNRNITIKGDIIATYKKVKKRVDRDNKGMKYILKEEIIKNFQKNDMLTMSELISISVNTVLSLNQVVESFDYMNIIKENCVYSTELKGWLLK